MGEHCPQDCITNTYDVKEKFETLADESGMVIVINIKGEEFRGTNIGKVSFSPSIAYIHFVYLMYQREIVLFSI